MKIKSFLHLNETNKFLLLNSVVIILLATIMLPVINYDYLYAAQDHSIFMQGHTFMMEKLSVPGGFLDWIGCYLTQFFYYPWLGSTILILNWVISYLITVKAFNLKGIWTLLALLPIIALLCSVIDLGYWLYYIKNLGYWFSESLGYLFVISAIWGMQVNSQRSTVNGKKLLNSLTSLLYILVWGIAGYILLGWWGVLGLIVMACMRNTSLVGRIVAVVTLVAVPWIAYNCYSQFRIEEAWYIGLPIFQHLNYTDWSISIPFFIIIITLPLCSIFSKHFVAQPKSTPLTVFALVIVWHIYGYITFSYNFSDKNFHSELRMYRQIEECRWQDAIDEFSRNQSHPTHQMVMCKNIALNALGQLGEKMFEINNVGCKPNADSLQVRMVATAGPLLYYYNGLINYAYRWAIENEVKHGLSVSLLRMMARCAIWNQEYDLASKYLTMLRATSFNKKWAKEHGQMIYNLSAFIESPEYKAIAPIEVAGSGTLDSDNGLCEEFIIYWFACLIPQNSVQQEMAVCYAMMLKDDDLMKFQIENYYTTHSAENVPKHIVEAVDLLNQQHSPNFAKFIADYQTFIGSGGKIAEVGQKMKPLYSKTYWWYYYFLNDFNIY